MVKYGFVDSEHNERGNTNPVSKTCTGLDVSMSGFYRWPGRPQSVSPARRHALSAPTHHFFEDSNGTLGLRPIHADLVEEGTECSLELVRHIMGGQGLIACQPPPFRITTEVEAEAAW